LSVVFLQEAPDAVCEAAPVCDAVIDPVGFIDAPSDDGGDVSAGVSADDSTEPAPIARVLGGVFEPGIQSQIECG
jgi:hypothetical protein